MTWPQCSHRAINLGQDGLGGSLLTDNNKTKQQIERKSMNDKFDELAKGLVQSTTRRQALKKFGVGLAGMALAGFGLAKRAAAGNTCLPTGSLCTGNGQCCSGLCGKRGRDTILRHVGTCS
jgi:hypothetical protein